MQGSPRILNRAAAPQPPFSVREKARAKVNLTLHIKGKRPDGYHEVESLVAFADVCDELLISSASTDRLSMQGPFASAIEGENLIFKAKRLVADWLQTEISGEFHLFKNIPVAAGLGGGSSNAAAAIRALLRAYDAPAGSLDALSPLSAKIGADVPVCLHHGAARVRGLGERVQPVSHTGGLPALLVNPRVLLSTASVFKALKAAPYDGKEEDGRLPIAFGWRDPREAAHALMEGRNDLEAPAIALQPVIESVLRALRSLDGCLLARLSGSGPTCFGLFATPADAERAEEKLLKAEPNWWTAVTTLS